LIVRRRVPALIALAGLAGCAAGPDYSVPPAPASQALSQGRFLQDRAAAMESAAPASQWWQAIGDAELSRLVELALRESPTVAAAEARLRQARAGATAARAAALPGINASLLYGRVDTPEDSLGQLDLFNAGFDAQWEFDLWGGRRRDAERAVAETGAADARLADARVVLAAEVARVYAGLRRAEAASTLIARRAVLQGRLVAIAERRLAGGTAPRQPLEAARASLARSEAQLAGQRAEAQVWRGALAVLTGQAPGALDDLSPAAIPLPPARVAIGDPAAMLARRPDIRAAERQLAAASARIGIEQARRLPAISFLGLIGIGGGEPGDLFDPDNLSAIAVPRLSWSVLDFGRGKAAVAGAEAARDAALADYRGQVLAALQDAEAALARFGAARIALGEAGVAARGAGEIARLQALRARGGTLADADALEAERQALDARLAESEARADLALAYAALAKALGLGWGG
jgi:NodT family efflux transporter outer membrane factor (OMF) lipoprotein